MTTSYSVEEKIDGHYRGLVVTVLEHSALIHVNFDDNLHFELSLDELMFLGRASGTLPDWVRTADGVPGPSRPAKTAQAVTKPEPAQKQTAVDEEPKAVRHGSRWDAAEDAKLLAVFKAAKQSVPEMSRDFGRSPASIVSRLLHLDAIEVIPKR